MNENTPRKTARPIAPFVVKLSVIVRKEFPVIAKGAVSMAMICALVAIDWIALECAAVFTLATFTLTAFHAGKVYQRINSRKEK